jgi:nucleotide-binding universal stress UspA family protein
MKILLAVDGSACSDEAVREVARRPWPAGSAVKVLSVVELPLVPTTETWALPDSYYAQLEQAGREQARAALDRAVEQLRAGQGLEITTEIIEGQAKEIILSEAEVWGADLIVLGSHGYRGWQRFLLGSVSQAVASHAKCSVEIVRGRQAEGK